LHILTVKGKGYALAEKKTKPNGMHLACLIKITGEIYKKKFG